MATKGKLSVGATNTICPEDLVDESNIIQKSTKADKK